MSGENSSLPLIFDGGHTYNYLVILRGFSSVVRALPCQGRGRELESLNPHQIKTSPWRTRRREESFRLSEAFFCVGRSLILAAKLLRFI